MKRLFIFLAAPLFLLACSSKKSSGGSQDTPEGVVNIIFDAAKNKDFSKLSTLCSPDADTDSKHICDMKEEDKESFITYFSKGKINGSATITGDAAAVPILFGPDGTKDETMNLVKKDGKWYLQSF
jgi:hypothetical protein